MSARTRRAPRARRGACAAMQLGAPAAASMGTPAARAACRELLDAGVAEAALRHGDGASEGLVVGRVGDELEVRHEVADLAPIVEAHRARRADTAMARLAAAPPRARGSARWCGRGRRSRVSAVGARWARRAAISSTTKSASSRSSRHAHGGDALAARRAWAAASCPCGRVFALMTTFARSRTSGVRAVVLLEAHDVCASGKSLLEVEDVPDVGAAPAVDGLVVVAHDAEVAVAAGEQLHELVLRAVGVLVLVDEDVLELAAVLLQLVRILRAASARAARAGRRSRRRSRAAARSPRSR